MPRRGVKGRDIHHFSISTRVNGKKYWGVRLLFAPDPIRYILVFQNTNIDAGTYKSRFLCAIGDGAIPTRIEEIGYIFLAQCRVVPIRDIPKVVNRYPQMTEWLERWLQNEPHR